jgi:ribosomal protein S18 acetylase RimI-like enzyme
MPIALRPATEHDYPSIVTLMNLAFRGKDGWSIEGEYITGERITLSLLTEEISKGALYLLAIEDATSTTLKGCVSLQSATPEKWHLGSLTVLPSLQNSGFGRELLAAAEQYAAANGALTIEMTVVHVREALIAWYQRRGYRRTGETRPFPYADTRYGTPTRPDLFFVVLEKHRRFPW